MMNRYRAEYLSNGLIRVFDYAAKTSVLKRGDEMKIYVGRCHDSFMAIFRSDTIPTERSHGHLYRYCIGPFRTLRGARFMAKYGAGNPHVNTVSDCEFIAKWEMTK